LETKVFASTEKLWLQTQQFASEMRSTAAVSENGDHFKYLLYESRKKEVSFRYSERKGTLNTYNQEHTSEIQK
jgi:hypothetical protein